MHFGSVIAVDASRLRVRVILPELDDLHTDWLPVLAHKTLRDKMYWLPDINEHVLVLLDENGDDGAVLGAIYSDADPVPSVSADKFHLRFADGGMIEYDRSTGAMFIKTIGPATVISGGEVNVTAAGPVMISAPSVTLDTPVVTCTGKLVVGNGLSISGGAGGAAASISGNVVVSGSIQASGSMLDGGVNSNHHTH